MKYTTSLVFLLGTLIIIAISSCGNTPYMQGMRLYEAKCSNCHMADGSGLSKLIPNIATSKNLNDTKYIACLLLNGKVDTIKENGEFLISEMPAFNRLSATEVTNIINYMQHRWQPGFKENYINDMEKILKECEGL